MTSVTSCFLAVTADNSIKLALSSLANIRAKVVLPIPAGPQNIKEVGFLELIIFLKMPSLPVILS